MRKLVLCTALGAVAVLTAAATPTDPECVQAANWVAAHRDALPATPTELASFSLAYRRQIIAALNVETKMALWKQHLVTVAGDPTVSTEARAALLAEADRLELYFSGSKEARLAKIAEMRTAFNTQFGTALGKRAFDGSTFLRSFGPTKVSGPDCDCAGVGGPECDWCQCRPVEGCDSESSAFGQGTCVGCIPPEKAKQS